MTVKLNRWNSKNVHNSSEVWTVLTSLAKYPMHMYCDCSSVAYGYINKSILTIGKIVICKLIVSNFSKFTNFNFFLSYAAKSLQSCPTLCDPIDGSPLGSAIPGILQARTLEWVAIPSMCESEK